MSPSKLTLKVGCPVILLRNLAPHQGLCNGSHLVVTKLEDHVIEARILCGDHATFSMTINKSQGQSIKYVGLDLRTPVSLMANSM
ncbi:9557_t:CDS:2 [Scutellospora calospora]|uniref:9557_t:CDS:1 n=1 Tax=Scutellospora calospora TaxID=85575 RepID=A0ACA9KNY6_9GLOM|nr:9557_t:CDS:2 [Scutellospora calospora]